MYVYEIRIKAIYLQIHIAVVNINTKEILSIKVTYEEVLNDNKVMLILVEHSLKQNNDNANIKVKTVIADDGVYNKDKNFTYLEKKRIKPGNKVR